ncbi:MAG: tRNA 4-thiouridine(8) synthase ThiI, partial [Clostridia bacterium]|nr:tRNA 4-thiouridine(8) synthase ThiI [Clostridia bacterium]
MLRSGLNIPIGYIPSGSTNDFASAINLSNDLIHAAFDIVSRVFGVSAFCRACELEKDMQAICKTAAEYLKNELSFAKTFKVVAKRSDKKFPKTSPENCREVGGYILSKFHNLSVDVINPEVTVVVEVRDTNAYVHGAQQNGA